MYVCTILCMYEGEAETTGKTDTEADRLTRRELMWCRNVDNHFYAIVCVCLTHTFYYLL